MDIEITAFKPKTAGEDDLAELTTHPDDRRSGVGTALLRHILPVLGDAGRRTVVGLGLTADGDGERWAMHSGFRETQRVVMLKLDLTAVPPESPDDVAVPGYLTRTWRGRVPADLLESYARARNHINDAPTGESSVAFTEWTAESVRAEEDEALATGIDVHVAVALEEATGEVRAVSIIHRLAGRQGFANQLETSVHPDHRGRGLARWVKTAVTAQVRDQRPDITRILTNVASSNAAMRAVNERMGFTMVRAMLTVETPFEDLVARLS